MYSLVLSNDFFQGDIKFIAYIKDYCCILKETLNNLHD